MSRNRIAREKAPQHRQEGAGRPGRPIAPSTPGDATTGPPGASVGWRDSILASYPRRTPQGEPGEVRVILSDFDGRPVLQIRHWVRDRSGRWVATTHGVTIPVNHVQAIRNALGEAYGRMMRSVADRPAEVE